MGVGSTRPATGGGVLVALALVASSPALAAQPGVQEPPGYYELFGDDSQSPQVAADVPFRGQVRAFVPRAPYPRAFHPLADGTVLLLFGEEGRVLHVDGVRQLAELQLGGGAFDPTRAELVDVLPGPEGGVIVLDRTAGTLWGADRAGKVSTRLGLFVSPTAAVVGADGMLHVRDPGNDSVVTVNPGTGMVSSRRGEGLTPHATVDGRLVFLRHGPHQRTVTLGLVPHQGNRPKAKLLTRLEAPEGMKVLDTRVLGVRGEALFVVMRLYRDHDERPRRTDVVRVEVRDGEAGAITRETVPTPVTYCLDCGPAYVLGDDGALWSYTQGREGYRVLRHDPGGRP